MATVLRWLWHHKHSRLRFHSYLCSGMGLGGYRRGWGLGRAGWGLGEPASLCVPLFSLVSRLTPPPLAHLGLFVHLEPGDGSRMGHFQNFRLVSED